MLFWRGSNRRTHLEVSSETDRRTAVVSGHVINIKQPSDVQETGGRWKAEITATSASLFATCSSLAEAAAAGWTVGD